MQRFRATILFILWLALLGLLHYEIQQKAPRTALGCLPGSTAAACAERAVRYRAHTGLPPLDRLLHEGQEAYVFYRGFLAAGR